MASILQNVCLLRYNEPSKHFEIILQNIDLKIEIFLQDLIFHISNKNGDSLMLRLNLKRINLCKLSSRQLLIESENCKIGKYDLSMFVLECNDDDHITFIIKRIEQCRSTLIYNGKDQKDVSMNQFDNRTEKWSATQYFQFYSYLSQQQNMMQDYIRTSTYQRAVLNNCIDFRNKVVLDVGAGSGILSFFAVQAGAKKVYAVEASNMSGFCDQLVRNNKFAGRIIVITGKIEEVSIPEPVDLLISEPMGYMLLNERMLETYVHARKFLRPDSPSMMFPTVANLYIAPFSDEILYMEVSGKANFWYQQSFHGVDLSSARESANKENFSQPIVDVFDINICMSPPLSHKIDFRTVLEEDLYFINVPLTFTFYQTGCCHGLAIWFDVGFLGSQMEVWLSTAPTEPLTHWYQVRCLFLTPLFVYEGQTVIGHMHMNANSRQSYDVEIELSLPGTSCRVANSLDLKNPYFRYTGLPIQSQAGSHCKLPSDAYFSMYNSGHNGANNTPSENISLGTPFVGIQATTAVTTVSAPKPPLSWAADTTPQPSQSPSYILMPSKLICSSSLSPFSSVLKPDEYEASCKWSSSSNKVQ